MYLIMELASGGELFEAIIAKGVFSEKDAASIIKQILSALVYLHRNRIAHRDLKPENFLFSEKDKPIQDSNIKIIDFGLSCRLPTTVEISAAEYDKDEIDLQVQEFPNGSRRVTLKSKQDSKFQGYNGWHVLDIDTAPVKTFMANRSFTKINELVRQKATASGTLTLTLKHPLGSLTTKAGTPYYVAPEVLGGSHNEMCDIWSLGVIAYILLCGYPPFPGNNDQSILIKVMRGKYHYEAADWEHISKDAKNLIDRMLTFDYRKRFTAEQCMQDIWIKNCAPNTTDVQVNTTFVNRLNGFRQQNALQKVALFAIASNVNDSSVAEMQKCFQRFDADGDGQLTFEEITTGLKEANIVVTEDIKELLNQIDSDGSGSIDYREFIAATLNKEQSQEEGLCWTAFKIFDQDGNGTITTDELEEVFKNRFEENELSADEIDDIMKQADLNGDGGIDFTEFLAMMRQADVKAEAA